MSERAASFLERIAIALERLVELEETRRKKPVEAEPPGVPPERLLEVWNSNRGGLPQAREAPEGSTRRRRMVAVLRVQPDLAKWSAAVRALASSPHHKGQNERGWVANIDFLIQANQFPKWLEAGAQRDAEPQGRGRQARTVWCACGKVATRGPGTRNPDLAELPVCDVCK